MSVVELAVGVSLVGIVMLLTLRGSAAIDVMRAYVMAKQIQSYQSAVMTYQAAFSRLPGDDPGAPGRYRRPPALTTSTEGIQVSLAGNGSLDGEFYDQLSPNSETFMAWRDLRHFKAVDGSPELVGASAMPENAFGGFFGFDAGNLGQTEGSLCASRVPGRAAQIIDNQLDDGRIDTGKLVATSKFSIADNNHFDAPDTAPYDIEKEYIICVPLLP
ncbi:MAG: hypothetical protein SFV19_12095 [Rhodospirillaceae bacterium]|nr:hypothetical protein [Rhodospirillaceae bacterium]